MLEMCLQQDWAFPKETLVKISESFGIITFGSSFMHGSETNLGAAQDTKSNDLFVFAIYQAAVANIPYDPIIHDLDYEPRARSAEQAVDAFLDMYDNKPVEEWHQLTSDIDLPSIWKTFGGIFGYILTVLFDPEIVEQFVPQIMDAFGIFSSEEREFLISAFLPAIRQAISSS